MVKCTNCRHGEISCYFDHYEDMVFKAMYCKVTDDWLSMKQAEDNAPCDFYEPNLDDDN